MLLQQIIKQLDAELDRLRALRQIVATLQGSSVVASVPSVRIGAALQRPAEAHPIPNLPKPLAEPVKLPLSPERRSRLGSRRIGQKMTPKMPRTEQPAPLRSAIPERPVVVSPAQLARERAVRQPAADAKDTSRRPVAQRVEDPDAFARNLASRWLSGPLTGTA